MSKLPRDIFVETIYKAALNDKDIYFVCADLGAKALDDFRRDLPDQFIHVGICEQNMMDLAAGLALSGKKVFVYAMASFITYRAYEQIKVAFSIMNQPVTIIAVGVGYSYEDASPTHYSLEDIATMRVLPNMEIYSPGDAASAEKAAQLALEKPSLKYIRLDRKHLPDLYSEAQKSELEDGVTEVITGEKVCILSTGFMHQRVTQIVEELSKKGMQAGVIDLFKIAPVNVEKLKSILSKYEKVIVVEEHFLAGGLGSIVAEVMMDNGMSQKLLRIGAEQKHVFENGGRELIQKLSGLDLETIMTKIEKFL